MILFDDHLAQRTTGFECSLVSGFDVNANSAMRKLRAGRWRRLALRCLVHVTRASWQIVLDSWQQTSSRIAQTECTHLQELLVHRANQWVSMDVCDKKRGDAAPSWTTSTQLHRSLTKRQRPRRKERRKKLPRSAKEPHRLSRVPIQRRARTLPVRDATANFMSSTPLRGRSCAAVDGVSPEHRVR